MALASDNSHRQAVKAASGKRHIPNCEGLVCNLSFGIGIPPPIPGVDDDVPVVLVVLVAARQDDRVRSLARAPGDAGLAVAVHPGVR